MVEVHYIEDIKELVDKAGSFFEDHYQGCEEYRVGRQKLSPDIEHIQKLVDSNVMNFFSIEVEGEFVGYLNVSVVPNPLLKEGQAVIDILYILPDHRNKDYAARAVENIEKELKAEGVRDINLMLPSKDYEEKVAKGLGYTKTSTVYTKILEA